MMASIRGRLFVILLAATSLVWASAVAWIFFSTRAQVEQVLDARLREAANMVHSLMLGQGMAPGQAATLAASPLATQESRYSRQLSCQIWSLDGKLLARSKGAPDEAFSASGNGFAEATIGAESWRVYAIEDSNLKVRVIVGDNMQMRDRLVTGVIAGLLVPALLILPLLAGLLWFSIGKGLAPLRRVAAALAARGPNDLQPFAEAQPATEIMPVIQSLNGLLQRVEIARRRERDFLSFAAHELRTPAAGLKTQAQVALMTQDDRRREQALRQIVIAVDRTSRLVTQLLDMSEAEHAEKQERSGLTQVGPVLAMLRDDLVRHGDEGPRVLIDAALDDIELEVRPELFQLAARNLLENALAHSPRDGVVRCRLATRGAETVIDIEDEGPGIPSEELARAVEPFFRGRTKAAVGSGLGLAIVDVALKRSGGELTLSDRPEGGLRARMTFPAARKSSAGETLLKT